MHALNKKIPCIYGSSKCLLPLEHPGSKCQNMVAFATVATAISNPDQPMLPAKYFCFNRAKINAAISLER